jgi:hypothetical protein
MKQRGEIQLAELKSIQGTLAYCERLNAASFDQARAIYGLSVFQSPPIGSGSKAPIFIVGLPRSGSTLVEQILATHSAVEGLGEAVLAANATADRVDWLQPTKLTRSSVRNLASKLLERAQDKGWRNSPRFVDKTLTGGIFIGYLHILFPNAVFIHSTREPPDVCFAAYRHPFAMGSATWFSADLGATGRYYVRHQAMMNHWAKVLPGRVVDIALEDLVNDFEPTARRLIAACGLPWEDQCLRFYENPREVRTASAAQVRRPIFTESLGRWRNYKDHLGPLFEALGPYAPKDI